MQMSYFKRCFNILVDFAATASQNVFRTFMVSPHEKTNIKKMTKKQFYYFYLVSLRSCEARSFHDTFVELFKHRFVMQPLHNSPICSSTIQKFNIWPTVEKGGGERKVTFSYYHLSPPMHLYSSIWWVFCTSIWRYMYITVHSSVQLHVKYVSHLLVSTIHTVKVDMKELDMGQTAHILCTEIYGLSGMDSDYAHFYHAVDDRFMTNWELWIIWLLMIPIRRVLLHNVAAHNVRVTGRVCYLT